MVSRAWLRAVSPTATMCSQNPWSEKYGHVQVPSTSSPRQVSRTSWETVLVTVAVVPPVEVLVMATSSMQSSPRSYTASPAASSSAVSLRTPSRMIAMRQASQAGGGRARSGSVSGRPGVTEPVGHRPALGRLDRRRAGSRRVAGALSPGAPEWPRHCRPRCTPAPQAPIRASPG